jgi:hypothetical protein
MKLHAVSATHVKSAIEPFSFQLFVLKFITSAVRLIILARSAAGKLMPDLTVPWRACA